MKSRWKWLIILSLVLDAVLFTGFVGLDWYYDDVTIKIAEHMARAHEGIWLQIDWIQEKLK